MGGRRATRCELCGRTWRGTVVNKRMSQRACSAPCPCTQVGRGRSRGSPALQRTPSWPHAHPTTPPPPSPPSRTKWTRLVHPSVLIGHVSSPPAPPRLPPPPPSPPSRTKWTRLVHPSVLIGHVLWRRSRPSRQTSRPAPLTRRAGAAARRRGRSGSDPCVGGAQVHGNGVASEESDVGEVARVQGP
jgi:hypothetical protein